MKTFTIALAALLSLSLASTTFAQEIYSGEGSSGTTTTTKPNDKPAEVHIAVPENAPEVRDQSSPFWQSIAATCDRLYFDPTEPYEGCDPGLGYAVGFMHYDINFWLPDSLTGSNNCVLYFIKDINPAECPWEILDPTAIRGIAIGIIF